MQHKSWIPSEYKFSKNYCIFMRKTYELCVKKSLWSSNTVKINMRTHSFSCCHFLWLPRAISLPSPKAPWLYFWFHVNYPVVFYLGHYFLLRRQSVPEMQVSSVRTTQEFPGPGFSDGRHSANTQNLFSFLPKMPIFKGNWVTPTQW